MKNGDISSLEAIVKLLLQTAKVDVLFKLGVDFNSVWLNGSVNYVDPRIPMKEYQD